MNDPRRDLVEKGYDRVAEQYLATKDPQDPVVLSALEEMAGENAGETWLRVLARKGARG